MVVEVCLYGDMVLTKERKQELNQCEVPEARTSICCCHHVLGGGGGARGGERRRGEGEGGKGRGEEEGGKGRGEEEGGGKRSSVSNWHHT